MVAVLCAGCPSIGGDDDDSTGDDARPGQELCTWSPSGPVTLNDQDSQDVTLVVNNVSYWTYIVDDSVTSGQFTAERRQSEESGGAQIPARTMSTYVWGVSACEVSGTLDVQIHALDGPGSETSPVGTCSLEIVCAPSVPAWPPCDDEVEPDGVEVIADDGPTNFDDPAHFSGCVAGGGSSRQLENGDEELYPWVLRPSGGSTSYQSLSVDAEVLDVDGDGGVAVTQGDDLVVYEVGADGLGASGSVGISVQSGGFSSAGELVVQGPPGIGGIAPLQRVSISAGAEGIVLTPQEPLIPVDGTLVRVGRQHVLIQEWLAGGELVAVDREGAAVMVSIPEPGAPGGSATGGDMSADGRFVVFESPDAFVVGDTNGGSDVYLVDRDPDGNGVFDELSPPAIERVSVGTDGAEVVNNHFVNPRISDDGRYVFFGGYTWGPPLEGAGAGIWVRDTLMDQTALVTVTTDGEDVDDQTELGACSPSGASVLLRSWAGNLDPTTPQDGLSHIFHAPNPL